MGKDKNAQKDMLNQMEADAASQNDSTPKEELKQEQIVEARQCQTCEATGLNPADSSQLCPDCGGSGTVE